MIKKTKLSFINGMSQDISKSKHIEGYYYHSKNLSITNIDDGSKYLLSNLKGNKLELEIPDIFIDYSENSILYATNEMSKGIYFNSDNIYDILDGNDLTIDNLIIIGGTETKDSIILFTTNNTVDVIWEIKNILDNQFNIELKYIGKLNLSTEFPIQALYNFENNKLQKIYFVDGNNQLRFFNKEDDNLLSYDTNKFNIVSEFILSQIELVNNQLSGSHTSGVIQYAYNLYDLYGSQTTISPLSELFQIDKGLHNGGGELNEELGKGLTLKLDILDDRFNYIKIYSIKYTSYNELPEISLIRDEKINIFNNYRFTDSGAIINNLSLEEFTFLGGNIIFPKHIESKNNRLFSFNIKEKPYQLNIDTRAYGHLHTGKCDIRENVYLENGNIQSDNLYNIETINYNIPKTHDSINMNYAQYTYQSDGITYGAEGKFIKVEVVQKEQNDLINNLKYNKFFKDYEIYRIGIKFYNTLGQYTEAKWICDLYTPKGNLEGNYNTLKVTIKDTEFNNYINNLNLSDDKVPVGFKILRARREETDKTILSQGAMTGMFLQTTNHITPVEYYRDNILNREIRSKEEVKKPSLLSRTFSDTIFPLRRTYHLRMINEVDPEYNWIFPGSSHKWNDEGYQEIYRDSDPDFKRQHSWQYTKMFQLYSPDILFNNQIYSNGLTLRIKGLVKNTGVNHWNRWIRADNYNIEDEDKSENTTILTTGNSGIFGPNIKYDNYYKVKNQLINRTYYEFVKNYSDLLLIPILGIPEITEKGQGITYYNNNPEEKYSNSLANFLTDSQKTSVIKNGLTSTQSEGNKCVTLMMDQDLKLENILEYVHIQNNEKDGLLLGEIVYPTIYRYAGVIYGGQSYEQKKLTSYIEIGKIINFNNSYISDIESPGDTYVQLFKMIRIVIKDNPDLINERSISYSEIIEFPVETTINLENRNDVSFSNWDIDFLPNNKKYHNYNNIYSQNQNILYSFSDNIKLSNITNYENKISVSKLKKPGEFIDNWTDILPNEEMFLDGKYGSINGTINYKDKILTFQDSAIAFININPRVQIQDQNNLSLELGTGDILHEYKYLTTTSGSLNKWSIISSPTGVYYTDLLNKSLNKIQGNTLDFGNIKQMDSYFNNNLEISTLKNDNPILNKGITGIYDEKLKLIHLTYLQNNPFTISIKDNENKFNTFHDYYPTKYFSKGDLLLSTNNDSKNIYSYYTNNYNTYFGTKFSSTLTILVNPDADHDKIFNNLFYNSEVNLNDLDISNITLNTIRAYTNYQDSNTIPLIFDRTKNLRRKFREWQAIIPRNEGSRDRIRNQWVFLELSFDYEENYQFKLHDIYINYTI